MESKRRSDHKRAYDLKLIDAVDYRQSFKYMSARNWRKGGEPYEPEFKGPELLSTALSSLGTKIELTVDQLCKDLHFAPSTFLAVTGRWCTHPEEKKSRSYRYAQRECVDVWGLTELVCEEFLWSCAFKILPFTRMS
jgi:hypothetical protein